MDFQLSIETQNTNIGRFFNNLVRRVSDKTWTGQMVGPMDIIMDQTMINSINLDIFYQNFYRKLTTFAYFLKWIKYFHLKLYICFIIGKYHAQNTSKLREMVYFHWSTICPMVLICPVQVLSLTLRMFQNHEK